MAEPTHYDNLQVSPNAPTEVIRAAYKSLAQKYHPDRNQSPEADFMMKAINVAYGVLSDPTKRKDYDLSLKKQEEADRAAAAAREPTKLERELQVKADKAAAEAATWIAWAAKAATEEKEAVQRAEKAAAQEAKAPPAEKAAWTAWSAKAATEALAAKERAAKAAAQSREAGEKATKAALELRAEREKANKETKKT